VPRVGFKAPTEPIELDYIPTAKQALFHASNAKEVLYGGAAGGGKSVAIVMDALMRCLKHPGTTAYVFRRTYHELEDTVIMEMRARYPQEICKYNVTQHEWRLFNGSRILCRHCEHIANMYDYRGAEIHWLYFDELTTFEQEIYDFIKTRLRAKVTLGVIPLVRSASNPGAIGHGWVKNRFVDSAPYGTVQQRSYYSDALGKAFTTTLQYIPSLAMDNPHISDDYIRELEQKPPKLRDAYLHGNWDAFEGQVFSEWENRPEGYQTRVGTHVISPFPIPPNWPHYMSFDYGYSKPFACLWWAFGPDGRGYIYKEWYGWDGQPDVGARLSPGLIAQGILEREMDERKDRVEIDRICDPALFRRQTGDSLKQLFDREKIYFRRGENERVAGKAEVHERLRMREIAQPDGSTVKRPMMQVFTNCTHVIRTVPVLPYSLTKAEDVDTNSEDHIYDSIRYALMSRPLLARNISKAIVKKQYDPLELDDDDTYWRN
jgi:PBSX family phage terminase large subunit